MHITDKVKDIQRRTELRIQSKDAEVIREFTYQNMLPAEAEAVLLGELDVVKDLLNLYHPLYRKHKFGQAFVEHQNLHKLLVKLVKDGKTSIAETISATNELLNSIWASPEYLKIHQEEVKNKEQVQEQAVVSKTTFEAYCEFTYVLDVDGKTMILTDEEAYSKFTGKPNYHGQYSISSLKDARFKSANYPFFKEANGKSVQTNIFDEWQISQERKMLTGLTFDPSTTARIVNGKFNIWQGWKDWGSAKEGADEPFWRLVKERICGSNEEYFGFVQKWLAHMIQKPWERPLCSLGIQSGQGTGKSLFVKIIGGLMNERHYNDNVKMSLLTGKDMGRDLEGVLLAYVDEATFGGDIAQAGHIKKAITGENDRINEKFVPAYNIPTYKRIIFSSNEGYYYHADADDRRLLPLEVPAELGPLPISWAQQIVNGQAYRPEVQATVLETLRKINITGWVPYHALKELKINTGAELMERSMSSLQRWMKDSIDNRTFECRNHHGDIYHADDEVVSIRELHESYELFCSYSALDKNRMLNLKSYACVNELREIFGHHAKVINRHGSHTRRYAIDWNEMRHNFEAKFKWKIDWSNPTASVSTLNIIKT